MDMKKDLSYETLAATTGTDWNTGRGELNKSLALIREEMPDVEDTLLADEIRLRARMYRNLMPNMLLTPTALAKHWKRVVEATRPAPKQVGHCETCDDHRLVLAHVTEDGYETYAPCPVCR